MIGWRLAIAPQPARKGDFEILFGSIPLKPREECGASLLGRNSGACARCGHRRGVRNQTVFLWYPTRVLPHTAAPPGPSRPICPLLITTKVGQARPKPHIGAPAGQLQLGCAQIRRHFPGIWKENGSNDRFKSPDFELIRGKPFFFSLRSRKITTQIC